MAGSSFSVLVWLCQWSSRDAAAARRPSTAVRRDRPARAAGPAAPAVDAGVDHGSPDGRRRRARRRRSGRAAPTSSPTAAPATSAPTRHRCSVDDTGAGDTDAHDTGSRCLRPLRDLVRRGQLAAVRFQRRRQRRLVSVRDRRLANSGLTTSLGASFTDGHTCPGALVLGVNFTAYGSPPVHGEAAATEHYYAASPNGRNWSAYKALHAWIKVQTADPLGSRRRLLLREVGRRRPAISRHVAISSRP